MNITPLEPDKPLILVVDDDIEIRLLLKHIMKQEGYEVAEAENGQECLDNYLRLRPDIVLMDGMMPVMNGFEACSRLQQLPGSDSTPVLMITGLDDSESVDAAFQAGATDYITKPIHRPVLRQRVRRLLDSKRTEQVLRLRDRAMTATSNGIMITVQDQNRNSPISYVNPAFEKLTGYASSEVLGREWEFLQGPNTSAKTISEIYEAIRDERECQLVLENYRKNDTSFWTELSISPVRDSSGRLTHFVWILHDITERKWAEDELRSERDFTAAVLDTAGALVIVLDRQGRLVRFNRACEQTTGYTFEEVRGKKFYDLFLIPEEIGSTMEVFKTMQAAPHASRNENYWKSKNGERHLIEWSNTNLYDDDGLIKYIVSTGSDITERKETEQNLQRLNKELTLNLAEIKQRNSEIAKLSEMGGYFQACRSPQDAYGVVSQLGKYIFPDETGTLYVLDETQQNVESVASWNNGSATNGNNAFTPDECWALRRGRLHLVEDTQKGLVCKHLEGTKLPKSYTCIPMMAQGQAIGVLYLGYSRIDPIPASKQQLALTVAEQVGLGLANLKLQETLRNQSIRDPLTGLYNRRYMEEALEREIRRSLRNEQTMGVIMVDVDHFKKFNDTFGHDAGDVVLREVARFLQDSTRKEDLVCRFGGEEFVLILPQFAVEYASIRAEELRQGIKNLKVQHNGQMLGQITASVGVSLYPNHGLNSQSLVKAADVALYQAKEGGRDQIVIANFS